MPVAGYIGDYKVGATITFKFSIEGTSVSPQTVTSPTLACYKEGSTTEGTTGVTLTPTYDSRTGMFDVTVDTSADGAFFVTGKNYDLVMTGGTVGGQTVVGIAVGRFSIEKVSALRPTTAGRTLVVDAAGLADANAVKVGPTGAGSAQTARDLGLSVLVSAGTGTGQLDITSGRIKADTVFWAAAAVATVNVSGVPKVDVVDWLGSAPAALTSQRVNAIAYDTDGDVCLSRAALTHFIPAIGGGPYAGALPPTVSSATANTVTFSANAKFPTTDGALCGCGISFPNDASTTHLGQPRTIIAWDQATRTATVDRVWDFIPTAADQAIIWEMPTPSVSSTGQVNPNLTGASVTVTGPLVASGVIQIVQGDAYYNADGRALEWTSTSWPDLTGATVVFSAKNNVTTALDIANHAMTVVTPTGTAKVRLELAASDTINLAIGVKAYSWDVQATLTNGHVVTLANGALTVVEDYSTP